MKATISIVFLMTSIAVGTLTSAGDMDEPLNDRALVLLEHSGLFVETPTASNFLVMEVRVFDADNQRVFRARSLGEPVDLYAIDLPDGEYSYEIVSVLDTGVDAEEGAQAETETSTRANGRIRVYGGEIIEGRLPYGKFIPNKWDQASFMDRPVNPVMLLVEQVFNNFISTASAADLTALSSHPTLRFDDLDTAIIDWTIEGYGEGDNGEFALFDNLINNGHKVLSINGQKDVTQNEQSMVIDVDGDIHWANGGMNFDKGQSALSIGTLEQNGHIHISDSAPAIVFTDESAGQQSTFTLDHNQVRFFGRPGGGSWRKIMVYDVNAPADSLAIDATGNVGLGLGNPARQLHLKGSNAVFRMDRSSNSAAFMLVRTTGGGTPMKTFVVGTNASGSDNGEFVINDLHTAVAGGGSRRMTINNSGNVNFPGTVTAANIAAPSSRDLKKNIGPIDDPLQLTQQLEGVRFDWKSNDATSLGFIAEDLQQVLPEVVLHDEGSGEMLGVNYAAVVPVLVEAIKSQQREIGALREQVATLEGHETRLSQLEALIAGGKPQVALARN